MKWNDEAFYLLDGFYADIFLILKESYNFRQSKKKTKSGKTGKLSENQIEIRLPEEILQRLNKGPLPEDPNDIDPIVRDALIEHNTTFKSFEMHNNANFLYVFTLFEKYLYDLINLAFKTNRSFKEKYRQQFVNFAKSRQEQGDGRFIDMLISDKKMIQNIDELQHPHKLLSNILSVTAKII